MRKNRPFWYVHHPFFDKNKLFKFKLNFTFCPSSSVLFKSKMINSFRYVHHPVLSLVVFYFLNEKI